MAAPAVLEPLLSSWSSYYGDHQMVSVTVRYLHLAAIVISGGTAVALDRQVLRATRATGDERRTLLATLRGSHRVVVPALAAVMSTGALLTAADIDTFLNSNLYWIKMGLVTLLLANGVFLLMAEAAAERADDWGRLRLAAGASLGLWLGTLFVGTWLTTGA